MSRIGRLARLREAAPSHVIRNFVSAEGACHSPLRNDGGPLYNIRRWDEKDLDCGRCGSTVVSQPRIEFEAYWSNLPVVSYLCIPSSLTGRVQIVVGCYKATHALGRNISRHGTRSAEVRDQNVTCPLRPISRPAKSSVCTVQYSAVICQHLRSQSGAFAFRIYSDGYLCRSIHATIVSNLPTF
jgi:hypothetical protein